jgi:transcription initiation factor TFIIIB Brf1 subunit/transcription initiation factor TFIIB
MPNHDNGSNSSLTSADDPEILDPVLDRLDVSKRTRDVAFELASTVEDSMWVVGKRRTSVAATAVLVACRATDEPVSQRKVGEESDSSTAAISNHKQDLLDTYLDKSDEPVEPLAGLKSEGL